MNDHEPEVLQVSLRYLLVCVPSRWTDAEIETFANRQRPTGIRSQWQVTTSKNADGGDAPRYVGCETKPGPGRSKHVVLVC